MYVYYGMYGKNPYTGNSEKITRIAMMFLKNTYGSTTKWHALAETGHGETSGIYLGPWY